MQEADTRVLAFLHISGMGQLDNNIGELEDVRWARVEKAVRGSADVPRSDRGESRLGCRKQYSAIMILSLWNGRLKLQVNSANR